MKKKLYQETLALIDQFDLELAPFWSECLTKKECADLLVYGNTIEDYYYLKYDHDMPEMLTEQNWCFETVRTAKNMFYSFEEAKRWCSTLNHRFLSRMPWHIRYTGDNEFDEYIW